MSNWAHGPHFFTISLFKNISEIIIYLNIKPFYSLRIISFVLSFGRVLIIKGFFFKLNRYIFSKHTFPNPWYTFFICLISHIISDLIHRHSCVQLWYNCHCVPSPSWNQVTHCSCGRHQSYSVSWGAGHQTDRGSQCWWPPRGREGHQDGGHCHCQQPRSPTGVAIFVKGR